MPAHLPARKLLQLGAFSLDTKLDSFAYSPGGAFIPPAWRGSDLPLIWSCNPTAPSEGESAASNHLPAGCCCQCSFRCLSTNRHIRHLSHQSGPPEPLTTPRSALDHQNMRLLPLFGAHNSQHRTAGTQAACLPGRVLLGFPRHRFAPPLLLLAAGTTQALSKQGPVFLGGGPGGQVTIPGIATVPMESQPTGFTLLNKDGFTLALADHGPAISLWGGRLTLTMRCAAWPRLGSFPGFLPRGGVANAVHASLARG